MGVFNKVYSLNQVKLGQLRPAEIASHKILSLQLNVPEERIPDFQVKTCAEYAF